MGCLASEQKAYMQGSCCDWEAQRAAGLSAGGNSKENGDEVGGGGFQQVGRYDYDNAPAGMLSWLLNCYLSLVNC